MPVNHQRKERCKMRKTFSFLVALTMLLSVFTQSISVNAAFSDVADDNSYKNAITTLTTLKVINGYDDGTFKPDQSITRAEFTKLVVYMLGYGAFSTQITQFNDVPTTHWANANIKTAYDLNIINGYDDTTFKPDDSVTYEQALKMMVCTLGYQSFAEGKGGYPKGYQAQGSTLGLTKGVSGVAYDAPATRGVVAQIMYNALEVDMYELKDNEWKSANKTLLNDYLNVYKLKGTVVGVEESTTSDCKTDLYPGQMSVLDSKTNEEYIIDYTEYTKVLSEMTAFLGQTVQVYYRQDKNSEDRWLVEVDNETYSNKELLLYSYEIDSYSGYTIKYLKEGATRPTSVKLNSDELSVRYNGRAVDGLDDLDAWLDPDSEDFIYGTIKLIDSGSNGTYNIIDIYDYETIVAVSSPSSSDYRITDKIVTGKNLILDPNSSDYKYSIKKNDKEIETTQIAANDVVNYAESLDQKPYYTVYSTAKSVKGEITSLEISDPKDATISIDNVEYRVSERFLEYIEKKEMKTLSTGMAITAYQDMFGTLEWGTVTTSDKYYPYAYVIDAVEEGEECYLKLYAPTNTSITSLTASTAYKVKSFKLASNVKLNGKKSSPESVVGALAANAKAANPDKDMSRVNLTGYNQLVRINVSGSEIADIAIFDSGNDGNKNVDTATIVRYSAMDPAKKYTVSQTSVKAGDITYSIKTSTPLFVIPKDRTDTKGYSVKSAISTNSMSSGGSYYLDAYDVNDSKYPACIAVYASAFKSGTAIVWSTAYRLVSQNIKAEYDSTEGETVDKLYTYNSTSTESSVALSSSFSGVGKGDIVLVGLDKENKADNYMLVQDYDKIKEILNGKKVNEQTYNWTEEQTQTKDNNWQKYVYDWRYPKSGASEGDNYYEDRGNITGIASRAAMYNVMQVLSEDNMLYLMQTGFEEDGTYDENNYLEIKTSSSTKIVRYDADKDEFTPYAEGTDSTALAVSDLKDAKNYGSGCSKILLTYASSSLTASSSTTPTAKFIVIYE